MFLIRILLISVTLMWADLVLNPVMAWDTLDDLSVPGVRSPSAEEQQQFNYAMSAMIGGRSEKARQLLEPLARTGVTTAQAALASLLNRSNEPADHKAALKWSYFAAHGGEWQSQLTVAQAYRRGDIVPRDLYQALSWLDRAAAEGGPEVKAAMDEVTRDALEAAGRAIKAKDFARAEQLLTPVAQWGHEEAQLQLGQMHEKGELAGGVKEARYWYQLAADQGSQPAEYALARSYLSESNLSTDQQRHVVDLLRKAARPGVPEAQYQLGMLYFAGWGVSKNAGEGVHWYRMAAEQGLPDAQYKLGVRYVTGKGVGKDPYEAHRWFRRAAEQGMPKAQHNLALTYLHGIGTDPQPDLARSWFEQAAANGIQKANEFLQEAQGSPIKQASAPSRPEPKTVDLAKTTPATDSRPYQPLDGWTWFNRLPAQGYTIQVISSRKAQSVGAFLQTNHLQNDDYLHYLQKTSKRPWHVVQYGWYKTKEEADAAAAKISGNYSRFKPWVRPMATIKRKFNGS